MSTVSSVRVSPLAYKKLVLHAAKYPTSRVLGLLLADSSSSSELLITDSIPLSHHWTSLAPAAEAALSLATSYAATRKLVVVGVYEAPELVATVAPSTHALRLAEKIAGLARREAVLVRVNNATILNPNTHAMTAYPVAMAQGKTEQKPKPLKQEALTLQQPDQVQKLYDAMNTSGDWEHLVDFDGKSPPPAPIQDRNADIDVCGCGTDHLENPALDWLQNPAISA
ncbi:hypothetical protein L1887_55720 [Cichorium endivia]|jgi:hypothetical protein|nr:hypothetical protein L1887_55720 [Cichorium endivia]